MRDLTVRETIERDPAGRITLSDVTLSKGVSRYPVPALKIGAEPVPVPGTAWNRQEPVPSTPEYLPFPRDRDAEPAEAEE